MKYVTYGISEIIPERFRTPYLWSWRGRGDKPCGGFWASPVDAEHSWYTECHKLEGVERDFMYPEGFDEAFERKVIFELKSDAKILKIKSAEDYVETLLKYWTHLGYEFKKDGTWAKDYDIYGIDWEQVAQEYDAIEVTYDGIKDIEEMLDSINSAEKKVLGLGTWAVDSICLCNLDCIKEVV